MVKSVREKPVMTALSQNRAQLLSSQTNKIFNYKSIIFFSHYKECNNTAVLRDDTKFCIIFQITTPKMDYFIRYTKELFRRFIYNKKHFVYFINVLISCRIAILFTITKDNAKTIVNNQNICFLRFLYC